MPSCDILEMSQEGVFVMARRIIQPDMRRRVAALVGDILRLLTCMLAGLSLALLVLMVCVNGEIALSLVIRGMAPQETLAYTGLLAGSAGFVLWLLLCSAEAVPPPWLLVSALVKAAVCGVAMCLMDTSKALRLPGLIVSVLLALHALYGLLERRSRQEEA